MAKQTEQVTYGELLNETLGELHAKSERLHLLTIFIEQQGLKEQAEKFISSFTEVH